MRFLGVVTPDFSFDSSFPKDGATKQKRKKANTLTSIFLYSKLQIYENDFVMKVELLCICNTHGEDSGAFC